MYIAFAVAPPTKGAHTGAQLTEVNAGANVADVYRDYIILGKAFQAHYQSTEVDLFTMPKFTIESELNNIQQNLTGGGYGPLFSKGALSRMSADSRAQLSIIMQKAKIIVNEEGSEAAAVTVGAVVTESVRLPKHVKVNGPFAYAIRDDKSGVTLFEGIVRNP
jgi:serine protease inhibitor